MLAGYGALLAAGTRAQWDAEAVDLQRDLAAWRALSAQNRQRLQRLLAGFWVAEHQVAQHLDPYLMSCPAVARECLERQRADELRHARFFDRALRELAGLDPERDAVALAGERIEELFCARLRDTAAELARGSCDLGEAVWLYHLVLEAIVLSAGQAALLGLCASLPATAGAIARVQRDERWHVGLGVTLLDRDAARGDDSAPTGAPRTAIATDRLEALAAWASRAWGRDLVDQPACERALAGHRRRVALLGRSRSS